MPDDIRWMKQALALAKKGEGLTRPNPPVGALVVRQGRVVGRGWHRRAGAPHAEVLALREAGARAKGADLYVTLEPCCTQGRTPPCTEAIRQAGIRRVIMACRDPNPRHRGRGANNLRRAGCGVVEGVERDAARELIAPFARWMTSKMPHVTLKLGMTLDGKIADSRGRSRWITGPTSRREVQTLRRAADAILVGTRTALCDDPVLLPAPAWNRKPYRVILDAKGRVPPEARVLSDGCQAQTILATTNRCPESRRRAWRARGADVWVLPGASGGVALRPLLRRLGGLGVLRVLCEGGADLAESLIRGRLVNEIVMMVAPTILGGRNAVPAVGGQGWRLGRQPGVRIVEIRRLGCDLMIRAVPVGVG